MSDDEGQQAQPTIMFGHMGPYNKSLEDFASYEERLQQFFIANGITDNQKQLAIFLTTMGPSCYKLLKDLLAPNTPAQSTYADVVRTLSDHYSPRPLVIAERYKFYRRNQEPGESISQFIAAIRKLAAQCEFGQFLDEALRDKLVCGLKSESCQRRLLTEPNLTLPRAIEIAIGMEAADTGSKVIHDPLQVAASSELVCNVKSNNGSKSKPANLRNRESLIQRPCPSCGDKGHLRSECRHATAICRVCHKRGHLAKVCWNAEDYEAGGESADTASKGNRRGRINKLCAQDTDDDDDNWAN